MADDVISEFPRGFFNSKQQIIPGAPKVLEQEQEYIGAGSEIRVPAGEIVREDAIRIFEYDPASAEQLESRADGCVVWRVKRVTFEYSQIKWILRGADVPEVVLFQSSKEEVEQQWVRFLICKEGDERVIREQTNIPPSEDTPKPPKEKPKLPGPNVTLMVQPDAIVQGESALLIWTSGDATSIDILPGVGRVAAGGSVVVSPTETTIYTILAEGPGGKAATSAIVTVTIPAKPLPPSTPPPAGKLPTPTITPPPPAAPPVKGQPPLVGPSPGFGDFFNFWKWWFFGALSAVLAVFVVYLGIGCSNINVRIVASNAVIADAAATATRAAMERETLAARATLLAEELHKTATLVAIEGETATSVVNDTATARRATEALLKTATALAEELAETATVMAIETEEAHDQETRVAIQKTQPDTPTPIPFILPSPTQTPTRTPTPKPFNTPPPPPPPPQVGFRVPSKFKGRPYVKFDKAGHICCIVLPEEIEIEVQEPAVTFLGPPPWITVSGERNADGSFSASGVGKVAGFDNIRVTFTGFISQTMSADYTFGEGGGLPQNEPIVFHIDGEIINPPATVQIDPQLAQFLAEFVPAQQRVDTDFLMAHLAPEVIQLYGQEQCLNFLQTNPVGADYNIQVIGVRGPEPWNYNPDGRSIPVLDVWYVNAFVTAQGQTAQRELHFAVTPNLIKYFADCGDILN